jgi:hypothetical protein
MRRTRRGDTPIRPVHGKSMARALHSQGEAISESPCPWEANEKRFAFTHWLLHGRRRIGVRRSLKAHEKSFTFTHWHIMGIGGAECRASDSEPSQIAKRTPHGRRQSAAPCDAHAWGGGFWAFSVPLETRNWLIDSIRPPRLASRAFRRTGISSGFLDAGVSSRTHDINHHDGYQKKGCEIRSEKRRF